MGAQSTKCKEMTSVSAILLESLIWKCHYTKRIRLCLTVCTGLALVSIPPRFVLTPFFVRAFSLVLLRLRPARGSSFAPNRRQLFAYFQSSNPLESCRLGSLANLLDSLFLDTIISVCVPSHTHTLSNDKYIHVNM